MEALEQGKRRREILAAAAAAAANKPRAPPGLSPAPLVTKRTNSSQKTPSTMTPDPKTARIEIDSAKKQLFGHLVAVLVLVVLLSSVASHVLASLNAPRNPFRS